jgi:hypothetical protein
MNKTILNAAVAATLSAAVMAPAQAGVANFDWTGMFTMLDSAGAAMANSSIPAKGNNQYQTPISGTMSFDTVTGAGTATLVPFNFFSNDPTLPAEAVGINMQAIGDGMGGSGTLVLGNMLFNWNGNNGIPVSLVLDAEGFFTNGASAATPASDGTYVGATVPGTVNGPGGFAGYLGLGPIPIATTAWNTTSNCSRPGNVNDGACMGLAPSGVLPMVFDNATNTNDYTANTGGNIGGNPFIDGPFTGSNANFDVVTLTPTSFDANGFIPPNCDFDPSGNLCAPPAVPVPAAVWLFGSGLLGLVGVARRRKS